MLNFLCVAAFPHLQPMVVGLSMICGISNGFLTSFIFFWKSNEAVARWKKLILNYFAEPDPHTSDSLGNNSPTNSEIFLPQDFMDDDFDYRESRLTSTATLSPLNDL